VAATTGVGRRIDPKELSMGIFGDTHPQPGGLPTTSPFQSDSVLSRLARGDYKPTDEDLEELRRLAQNGNRADRRAAAKQLKRLGIAAPQPAPPRSPVVMPEVAADAPGDGAEPAAAAHAQAQKQRPAKKEPAKQPKAQKQSAPPKAGPGKTDGKKASAAKPSSGRTATEKPAAKKAGAMKRIAASLKAAVKKTPAKKAPTSRAPAKKAPAKKAAGRKSGRK
jgi:hypothetical protein